MTTGRFVATLAAVVCLILIFVGAIVGLEIADRPVSTVVELYVAVLVPTVPVLLALLKIQNLTHDIRNGVGDGIAAKAAVQTAAIAARVAADVASASPPLPGGKRATDPPPIVPLPPPV